MKMKVPKKIIFLALFLITLDEIDSRAPAFNAREISRLVARVDPKTCNCVTQDHCNIDIPYTKFLGIECKAPGTKFCCNARKTIKPYVTAKDLAEVAAAAKRLKLNLNGKMEGKSLGPMVANADPKQVASTVEKIQEVEKELQNSEESETIQAQDKIEEIRDHCQCLETSQCPEEKIDVYFGKACQTPGTVRCCDHIQKREEIPQKTIDLHQSSQESISNPLLENLREVPPSQINSKKEIGISENFEPLPLEPLTFISTTPATIKKDPVFLNNPVPTMVTKMPLARLKSSKMGVPINFYRYTVPVQNLADSIMNKKKVAYQPGPIQGTLGGRSQMRSDQKKDETVHEDKDTNIQSNLNQARTEQRPNIQHHNRLPEFPTQQQVNPTQQQVYPTQKQVYPTQKEVYPTQQQVYPTQQQVYPDQHLYPGPTQQELENLRRKNCFFCVSGLLNPLNWFG